MSNEYLSFEAKQLLIVAAKHGSFYKHPENQGAVDELIAMGYVQVFKERGFLHGLTHAGYAAIKQIAREEAACGARVLPQPPINRERSLQVEATRKHARQGGKPCIVCKNILAEPGRSYCAACRTKTFRSE